MEQWLTQWLTEHGASAAVVVIVLALYAQLVPALLAALRAQAEQVNNQAAHDVLLGLVRAAEQVFGAASSAENNAAKLAYVQENAPAATVAEIEAAVHEVKAPLKAASRAVIRSVTPAQALELIDKAAPAARARVEMAKRMATAASGQAAAAAPAVEKT